MISDEHFASRLDKKVEEISKDIELLLGPFANPSSSTAARMRRLKHIVQQAAELAVECSKEPSLFTFFTYPEGAECDSMRMSDALGSIADEQLGEDGAVVKYTVSPAVLRTSGSEQVVVLKARVVLQAQQDPDASGLDQQNPDNPGPDQQDPDTHSLDQKDQK